MVTHYDTLDIGIGLSKFTCTCTLGIFIYFPCNGITNQTICLAGRFYFSVGKSLNGLLKLPLNIKHESVMLKSKISASNLAGKYLMAAEAFPPCEKENICKNMTIHQLYMQNDQC